jgi:hypothetical protein
LQLRKKKISEVADFPEFPAKRAIMAAQKRSRQARGQIKARSKRREMAGYSVL